MADVGEDWRELEDARGTSAELKTGRRVGGQKVASILWANAIKAHRKCQRARQPLLCLSETQVPSTSRLAAMLATEVGCQTQFSLWKITRDCEGIEMVKPPE